VVKPFIEHFVDTLGTICESLCEIVSTFVDLVSNILCVYSVNTVETYNKHCLNILILCGNCASGV